MSDRPKTIVGWIEYKGVVYVNADDLTRYLYKRASKAPLKEYREALTLIAEELEDNSQAFREDR